MKYYKVTTNGGYQIQNEVDLVKNILESVDKFDKVTIEKTNMKDKEYKDLPY